MKLQELNNLLIIAIQASLTAGEEILKVYESGDPETRLKEDRTPLTQADLRSNSVITTKLQETGIPVLSEEGAGIPFDARKNWANFWMIDPLDGTKEFIKRNGEFTVNIALIENGSPIQGVIYTPVHQLLYFGQKGLGAFKIQLQAGHDFSDLEGWISASEKLPLQHQDNRVRVVGSRSHMSQETLEFVQNLRGDHPDLELISRGSSLKICMVAEGTARYYPRLGPTMEWDTAAGQAIAEAAGCTMIQYNTNQPVTYNKKDLLNPWFVVENHTFT